jgi:hypothetical protein
MDNAEYAQNTPESGMMEHLVEPTSAMSIKSMTNMDTVWHVELTLGQWRIEKEGQRMELLYQ